MANKQRFYITFGQQSPFRNGYVVIHATSRDNAQSEALEVLGKHWSMIYNHNEFEKAIEHFPAGQLGIIVEAL